MYDQPFHTLAYYTALLASGAANVSLGSVTEAVFLSDGTGYFMPDSLKLLAAYGGNDAYNAVRVNQPSLRTPFLPYVEPVSLTLLPANVPPIYKAFEMGLDLNQNEYLRFDGSRDVVVASPAVVIAWVGKQRRQIPGGDRRTIRFTSAAVAAAGTWALSAITFSDTLPQGKYAVVALNVFGTNAIAARLAFTGGGWRPGTLCQGAQGEWTEPAFDRYELGYLGSFFNTTPPQIEIFGSGATATQIGYMDLVQLQ